MARYKLQGRARDTWGNTISGLDIYIYVAGTSRLQDAIIYTSSTSTTAISASPQIQSDTYGFFSFWVDDTDYVASTTKFDLYADGLEYTYVDVFNIKHHGTMGGLKFDDHPRYPSVSAAEVIPGNWIIDGSWSFTVPPCGVTPSAAEHLVTKDYVDTSVASISAGEGLVESPANVLNVNPGNGIQITADAVTVKQDEVDHGSISGLGDDDHTQYSRADGTRAFTGTVGGITPVASNHLVTKGYVDTTVSISAGDGLVENPAYVLNVNPGSGIELISDEVRVKQSDLDHVNIQSIGTNTHAQIDSSLASIETSASDLQSQIDTLDTTVDDHLASASVHFTESSIDHVNIQSIGTNTHAEIDSSLSSIETSAATLRDDIDILDTTVGDHLASASVHFTESSIDHTNIQNIGTNTHTQIDSSLISIEASAAVLRDDIDTLDTTVGDHLASASVHFTESSIDHANIQNIGTNTHAEIDSSLASIEVSAATLRVDIDTLDTTVNDHLASASVHFTESSIDHGNLQGLLDDDHPQYPNRAQTESISGDWTFQGDANFNDITTFNADSTFNQDVTFNHNTWFNDDMTITSAARIEYNVLINEFSTDGTLFDNSNNKLVTQRAIKTYTDTQVQSVSATVAADYLRQDGTTPLEGDWDVGPYDITVGGDVHISGSLYTSGASVYTSAIHPLTSPSAAIAIIDGGAVELYYDGLKIFETLSDGILMGSSFQFTHDNTNMFITNNVDAGNIYLQGNDSSSISHTILSGSPDGATILYYDGFPRLETTTIGNGGILIRNDSNEVFDLYWSGSTFYIDNNINSAHIAITGTNAASGSTTMALFDPDGAAELYYDGNKVVETFQSGINSGLRFWDTVATEYADMWHNGNSFLIINRHHTGNITLQGENSSGVLKNLLIADPDIGASGGVTLYYDGTVSMSTRINGIDIINNTTLTATILHQEASDFQIYQFQPGYTVGIYGRQIVGSTKVSMADFDPDGAVELYYAGNKVAETTENGFTITTSAGTDVAVFDTVGVSLENGVTINEFSNDSTMSDASSSAVPTEYAVKTFVEAVSAARDEHNELKNIQGGIPSAGVPSASEYYHLDAQLYNQLSSTPSAALFSGGIHVDGHSAMGADSFIDFGAPGFGYGIILDLEENFDSSYTNLANGIYLSMRNDANDAGAATTGISSSVNNTTSTLHDSIVGFSGFASSANNTGAVVDSIIGNIGRASVAGDNSTITGMIGGDFDTVTGFSMANTSAAIMIGGRFGILQAGSGDVSITDGYGALIKTPGYNPTGTTTNLYGLYIEDQSTVGFTNDYNFYSAGATSSNKFEGDVDIDGTLGVDSIASTSLAISGDVHLTGSLYTSGASVYTSAVHPLSSEIVIGESTGTNLLIDSANKEATIILDGESTSDSVFHTEAASGSESYNWIGVLGNQLYWSTDSTGSNDFHIDLNDDNILRGDPTGALELYYAGSKVVETTSNGLQAATSTFTIKTAVGEDAITIQDNNRVTLYYNDNVIVSTHDAGIQARLSQWYINNSEGQNQIGVHGNPVTLNYDGSGVFETINNGIQLKHSGGLLADLYGDGASSFYIDSKESDGVMYIRTTKSAVGKVNGVVMDPQGSTDLYYSGDKVFETSATGIKTGSDLSTFTISTTAGWAGIKIHPQCTVDFYFNNVNVLSTTNDGLQSKLTSPFTLKNYTGWTGVAITSAGAAELYYNDNKKFETTSTGAEVTGDLEYLNISTVTAETTASNADVILCSGGSYTVNLTEKDRAIIRVKNIDSGNTITIQGLSGTIDGSANTTLTVQYESMTLVSDGSNWYIV